MAYYVPQTSDRVKAFFVDQILKMMIVAPFWKAAATGSGNQFLLSWGQLVLFVSVYLLYDIVSLYFFQKTPGQWVLGLQVVPQLRHAEPLNLHQVLMRVFVKQFNLFFSYAPDFMMLYRYDRRTLADLFAETRVVSETPRTERSQSRWIFASICIVYFCAVGWSEAVKTIRSMQVSKQGVSVKSSTADFELALDDIDLAGLGEED